MAKWGGPTNGEMKQLMLKHAFKSVSEVWFHIGPDNVRSQKAISKIGAAYEGEQTLEIGGKPIVMRAYCIRTTNWN